LRGLLAQELGNLVVRGRVVGERAFFVLDALIAGKGFAVASVGPPEVVRDAVGKRGAGAARRVLQVPAVKWTPESRQNCFGF
jgi:hypothetical protein